MLYPEASAIAELEDRKIKQSISDGARALGRARGLGRCLEAELGRAAAKVLGRVRDWVC